ncbi:CotY/CotZ family spore coat protein [Virgibacillus alimentarius]|uniref:Spore coat protein Z n=1 Tax=Virgibacillus alimentarius TaxID=698769 RepID=A0ABS4SAU2_9BACI|nr:MULTISPECIES: CotY/CotZ family spore coat protein [Virgibacillus]MBP2258625.1 spore coat protein Z [Virgibacillus alimentarius]HLR65835.1 CotY/CotZ family spore coat protein [Virgibacillus sp.]
MSCGKDHHTGSCVCDILKEIADAQQDVVENCCDTSCEQSISDLLGETEGGNDLDTVPVILYCKDGCKPFKGFGTHPDNIGHVEASFFFRVKKVMDDCSDSCCVVLELLRDAHCDVFNPHDPTEQKSHHLRATGICMTVDAECFCHVTCLPAISALNC